MLYYLKRSFVTLTPSIFSPCFKAFIRSHLEYAEQPISPIFSRVRQQSVQKRALKFVKELRHIPYETALWRLRLFSLVRRRIRGDLICMYTIMHVFLYFPSDTVFAATTHTGLRGYTFTIYQQRCKTRRRQRTFSVRVVPYWNKLPEEIVKAPSMETFKLRLDARWQSHFSGAPL